MIKMILATDQNGGLGMNNKLPWYFPEDLDYFKQQTTGCKVVMGRKTFESLPFKNGLPKRDNYILTLQKELWHNTWVDDEYELSICGLSKVLEEFGYNKKHDNDIWVIGGKGIYDLLFNYVKEIHHSCVSGEYECDTFIDTTKWEKSQDWQTFHTRKLSEDVTVKCWRKI